MFDWFSKREQGDAVADRLAEITGTPSAILHQVCNLVDELAEVGKLTAESLRAADTRLEPVLAEIVADTGIHAKRQAAGSNAGIRLLRSYTERFANAYGTLLASLPKEHADAPLLAVRAIALIGRACRLTRRLHEDPGPLRGKLLELFLAAQENGLTAQRLVPYPNAQETSAMQECAQTLLMETAPFDSLTVDQIEYFDRFITFYGARIQLKAVPGANTPFAVLREGRVLAPGQGDPDQAVLFVGPGALSSLMENVAGLKPENDFPSWVGKKIAHTNIQTLVTLAEKVTATWARKKIKRGSERVVRDDEVRVTGGFSNLRRAVAYSAYVRSGGKLKAYTTHSRVISEKVREVMVGLEEDRVPHTPIEILTSMESAGDSQVIETWRATDSSVTGYNLVVPAICPWLAVGGLLAIREPDSIDWLVGIVRRLYSVGGSRRVGIQILDGRSLSVGITVGTDTANINLGELADAILILGDTQSLLVTTTPCTIGTPYVLASSEGRQRLTISAQFAQNADYSVNIVEVA